VRAPAEDHDLLATLHHVDLCTLPIILVLARELLVTKFLQHLADACGHISGDPGNIMCVCVCVYVCVRVHVLTRTQRATTAASS